MPSVADPTDAKAALRERLRAVYARLSASERRNAAQAVASTLLTLPQLRASGTVAAYVGVGDELPTLPLLDTWAGQGKRVLLPVVAPGHTLQWREYAGAPALLVTARGLAEPAAGAPSAELSEADVVVVPGLGYDGDGHRLGRGGGYYDRALAEVDALVVGLALDEAVLDEIPSEAHDRAVDVVVTPTRTLWHN